MNIRTRTSALAAAALTLALAGCMSSLPFGPGTVEDVIEQTTGGGIEFGPTASVPADWPAELPLPDGALITSTSVEGTQSLIYSLTDVSIGERLVDDIVSRGFELVGTVDQGQLVSNTLSRDDWNVVVGWLITDDGVTLTYVSGSH